MNIYKKNILTILEMSHKNALSIDLEDWFHPEFVRKHVKHNPKSQILDSTKHIINFIR